MKRQCPYCKEMIDENLTVCPFCYENLPIINKISSKICPYCGEEIKPNAKKCKHCGQWIEDNQQEKEEKSQTKRCPFCGEKININAKKCKHCGEWIEETNEHNETKKCPYCKEEILAIAKKCKHCGKWLKENKNKFETKVETSSKEEKTNLFFTLFFIICMICIGAFFLIPNNPSNNINKIFSALQDPESELLSGCKDNGEEVIGFNDPKSQTIYYCNSKPWKAVKKYKGINDKHYNYNVYSSVADINIFDAYMGSSSIIGTYYWSRGNYYCKYHWNPSFQPCTMENFVIELKRGISGEFKKNDYNLANSKKTNKPNSNIVIPTPRTNIPQLSSHAGTGPVASPSGTGNKTGSGLRFVPTGSGSSGIGRGTGNVGNPRTGNSNSIPRLENIKKPDFSPYMRDLQQRIKSKWEPPKGEESRRVVVLFTIAKDGELLSKKIIRSSGLQAADDAAMAAVSLSAPFKPFPDDYKENSVDIQFTFDYNVFSSRRY